MESDSRIEDLKKQIGELPVGYISRKTIHGSACCYRQWKEQGKVKSQYIPAENVDYTIMLIKERKMLQAELRFETYRNPSDKKSLKRLYAYAKSFFLSRNVPIGVQNYETLISKRQFYVDKTLFISDWWNHHDEVTLITRPRRFGKTLNLSMINCFFSINYAGRTDLFEGLEVWKDDTMRKLQGTFPVISISFGGIKEASVNGQMHSLKTLISQAFSACDFCLDALSEEAGQKYRKYTYELTDAMALEGIAVLSEFLYKVTGKKVLILLDEYDTPMLEAWSGGCFEECASCMRLFFNKTFKTNPYMERALLTSITRISKESFFSDINHLKVYSMSSSDYEYAFGFTEAEVLAAMNEQGLKNIDEVKSWYNGYTIGNRTDIYNPWSIINYLKTGEIRTYWVHSGSNRMISQFLQRGDIELKFALEDILNGKSIRTKMTEETPFQNILTDNTALWSLLFSAGYLKIISTSNEAWEKIYELAVTNREVLYFFQSLVKDWFPNSSNGYRDFTQALFLDDVDYMNEYLNRVTRNVFSYYDTTGREPERFYHGLFLGMLLDFEDRFIISSNRESGLGRFDVVLEPREPMKNHAIILEFKVRRPRTEASLEETADNALLQIYGKKYATDLIARGIEPENIYYYGFAFQGKEVYIKGARYTE